MKTIHRHMLVPGLLAALLGGCSGSETPKPDPHAIELQRADRRWMEGDPGRAMESLHGILETDTKSFGARYRQGVIRFRDEPREALADFEAAAALDPGHPGPRLFSGLVRMSLSDLEGADRDMANAESRAWERRGFPYPPPGDPVREGMDALTADRPREARDIFSLALDESPKRAELWALFASASLRSGEMDDAVEAAERALDLDERMAFAHVVLAGAASSREDPVATRAHLDLALEIDPRLAGAHYLYGALWLRESEYSRAANAFLQAMLEEPTSPESHFSLGRVLMSMRRNQIASNLMQQAEGVQQLLDRKYPPPNK